VGGKRGRERKCFVTVVTEDKKGGMVACTRGGRRTSKGVRGNESSFSLKRNQGIAEIIRQKKKNGGEEKLKRDNGPRMTWGQVGFGY